jgi:hypothetical protein
MKRGTTILLAAAVALLFAPAAAAKDLTRAEVCGQSGCAKLPRDRNGDGLIQLRGSEGRKVSPAPTAGPYYLLVWEFGPPAEDGQTARFATLYAPSADLVAAPGMNPGSIEWFGASEPVLDKVRGAIRGLEPFAAPKQWPPVISPPANNPPTTSAPGSDGRDWTPWAFAAALALAVLAVVFSLARRLRLHGVRAA